MVSFFGKAYVSEQSIVDRAISLGIDSDAQISVLISDGSGAVIMAMRDTSDNPFGPAWHATFVG